MSQASPCLPRVHAQISHQSCSSEATRFGVYVLGSCQKYEVSKGTSTILVCTDFVDMRPVNSSDRKAKPTSAMRIKKHQVYSVKGDLGLWRR